MRRERDITFFELESMFANSERFQSGAQDIVYRNTGRREDGTRGERERARNRNRMSSAIRDRKMRRQNFEERAKERAYHSLGCNVEMLLAPGRRGSYVSC